MQFPVSIFWSNVYLRDKNSLDNFWIILDVESPQCCKFVYLRVKTYLLSWISASHNFRYSQTLIFFLINRGFRISSFLYFLSKYVHFRWHWNPFCVSTWLEHVPNVFFFIFVSDLPLPSFSSNFIKVQQTLTVIIGVRCFAMLSYWLYVWNTVL